MKRYFSFFVLSLGLAIAPGPDILFVLAQSLAQGASAGMFVTLGLCSGLVVHVLLAAFGFAAVMKRYPRLFSLITWFGAAYLAYLAWCAGCHAAAIDVAQASAPARAPLALYGRGVVMNLCNPKVVLFFLALVPRFIDPTRGCVGAQFVLLGILFAISALLVFNGVSLLGGSLASALMSTPSAGRILGFAAAFVMAALALWIALRNLRSQEFRN